MAEMPPARASDRVTVTQFLGAGPPGELRWTFGLLGLGAHGRPARSDVLTCPSGSLPRSVVRHIGMEVALWEGGRGAPTVAAVAVEAGLDERTVEVALEILAEITGYPLR